MSELTELPTFQGKAEPHAILSYGVRAAEGPVALACSFSVEDIIIIDMIKELDLLVRVFAIDTGRLHEATFELAEKIRRRYGVIICWYFPMHDDVQRLEREKGLHSFRDSIDDRHECCNIRKVEPLQRALKRLSGWITGLRREQSVTRTELAPIEVDHLNGGILKINPLIDWTDDQVRSYALSKDLPRNMLFDEGYLSIGCAPCTRPVRPGEHPRAGRWWWETPEQKECGLHSR